MAEFLRARREQLQPGDVGLPDNGRRRTPGLRREEVATLAGVSIDYLVRLEQGRDTKPSPSVIAALADALRLDDEQRRQLYTLAMISQTSELCPAARPLARAVAPTVTALLERPRHDAGVRRRPRQRRARVERRVGAARPPARNAR